MVFTLSSIAFVLVSIIVQISDTSAFPLDSTIGLDHTAREVLTNATLTSAPHFVVYSDAYDGTIGPTRRISYQSKVISYDSAQESVIHTIASDSQSFYLKSTQG